MNEDYENANRQMNAFKFLKYFNLGLCVVALAVAAVLWALGNSKWPAPMAVAPLLFILACVFSNAAHIYYNSMSFIELQKRVSELEVK
jgi:hypothetical protein